MNETATTEEVERANRLFGRFFLALVVVPPFLIFVLPAFVGSIAFALRGDSADGFWFLISIGGFVAILWMMAGLVLTAVARLVLFLWLRSRRRRGAH